MPIANCQLPIGLAGQLEREGFGVIGDAFNPVCTSEVRI